jgi:hypothetical protein
VRTTGFILGVGRITEENYLKWWTRYAAYMTACGDPQEKWFLTLSDVRRSIGLSTNVSDSTDAAFKKVLFRRLDERAQDIAKRDLKALTEADADVSTPEA